MPEEPLSRRVLAAVDSPDLTPYLADPLGRYLREEFPGLVGLPQLPAHFHDGLGRTTDPIEHTLEVLALLDTAGLPRGLQRCVRLAVLLHDVGKLRDPFDTDHYRVSIALAREPLESLSLTSAEVSLTLRLIETHDLLGRFLQGRITAQAALDRLDRNEQLLDLHCRIAIADISSIRGLDHVVASGSLERGRAELLNTLHGLIPPGLAERRHGKR